MIAVELISSSCCCEAIGPCGSRMPCRSQEQTSTAAQVTSQRGNPQLGFLVSLDEWSRDGAGEGHSSMETSGTEGCLATGATPGSGPCGPAASAVSPITK